MKAGILAIGTELLTGQTVNTNAAYLGSELATLGIGVYYHQTVGDNMDRMKLAISEMLDRVDVLITTGGLGPTQDDITKEMVAEVLNKKMLLDHNSLELIKERFRMFNRTMPESNVRQAYFPEGAIILDNKMGTAPACIIELENQKCIIVLPGPPREMKFIYSTYIKDYLSNKSKTKLSSRFLSIYDYGESAVEERLIDLIDGQTNPTFATYAGDGKVILRITASGPDASENEALCDQYSSVINERIGNHIVSYTGEDIDEVVLNKLIHKKLTISFAESCTGGKLISSLIKYSGASEVVDTGIVTYSNASKIRELNVREEILQTYGAVSHQTCYEMVKGLMEKTGSDISVSVTGIAGPNGGTLEKPVGLVYIGIGFSGEIFTFENKFTGDRELIQNRTVIKALKIIYDFLEKM